MGFWVLVVIIVVTGLLVARRWLPDPATVGDTAYDLFRGLVPAPRPTVRVVARRVARVCRRQRVAMPFGQKAVLPRSFVVDLSPQEYAVIEPLRETVAEAVGTSLVRVAREKQWVCAGPPQIRLRPSEQVAEGRPRVDSSTLPPPQEPAEHTRALAPAAEVTLQLPAAEQTVAEPIRAIHEHRLRAAGEEADIVVRERAVTVGRAAECEVVVHYPSASRRQLRLVPGAAGCRVEDLASRHGTFVNGRAVQAPLLLRPGDTVQIGSQGPVWTYQPTYRCADQPGRHGGPALREVR